MSAVPSGDSPPRKEKARAFPPNARRAVITTFLAVSLLASACSDEGEVTSPLGVLNDQSTATANEEQTQKTTDAPPQAGLAVAFPTGHTIGDTVTSLSQVGSLPLTIEVATRSGGLVTIGMGPDGGPVLDLPAFTRLKDPPRAFLRIVASPNEAGLSDPLAPGAANFSFGADFLTDEVSSGTTVDNGDNLMQRGLSSDASQYKIDLDRGRPSCKIKGSEGTVIAYAEDRIQPNRWYRADCFRKQDTVTLVLAELSPTSDSPETSTAKGPIGNLEWKESGTPLSIGGKLAANGGMIKSATDQFNGMIANPVLTIEDYSK